MFHVPGLTGGEASYFCLMGSVVWIHTRIHSVITQEPMWKEAVLGYTLWQSATPRYESTQEIPMNDLYVLEK